MTKRAISPTKLKILSAARKLFNEKGYGAVTNEMLAEAAGIAPGNLWYHFRTQRDLLSALSQEFVAEANARLEIRPSADGDVIQEYAAFLLDLGKELRRHRFLYRDQAEFGEFTEEMRKAVPGLYRRTFVQFDAFFRAMIARGLFTWEEDRLNDLIVSVVMIIRYNLEYRREAGMPAAGGSGAVRAGFALHLSIIEHRMKPTAAKALRAALLA
jgi:AcrR family transcriptional regulator